MAKQLPDIREIPEYIDGRKVLGVEINTEGRGDGDGGYIIIYFKGCRLYADSPALYSDDSGDAVAAF